MRIPTDQEIREIHEKLAPTAEALDLVYTHCQIVCQIAEQLLSRQPDLDGDLVRAGCMLHDIGVYRLYGPSGNTDHTYYVTHGVLGAELLAELKYPALLGRFCSRHTGMGLTRRDVLQQKLPIPLDDYLPTSGEEELVMFALEFVIRHLGEQYATTAPEHATIDGDTEAGRPRSRIDSRTARRRHRSSAHPTNTRRPGTQRRRRNRLPPSPARTLVHERAVHHQQN